MLFETRIAGEEPVAPITPDKHRLCLPIPLHSPNWTRCWPETLAVYRRRAFEREVRVGKMLWRAFDKTV